MEWKFKPALTSTCVAALITTYTMLSPNLNSLALLLLYLSSHLISASPILARNNDQPKPFDIFSAKGLAKLEGLRQKYDFQSFNLALVKKGDDGTWKKESHSLGAMDSKGTSVDDKVSPLTDASQIRLS